ncbi:MAG: dienelactone hydrolase family protein [Candidatus Marinimicrobia bacterium]|nr:dienelactone hydrolase family protein [Candidatus Neomarinimicrobiota bacterium]MCF7850628.1 dienelactone hydrolase family protein [Candidatus Neomarinimicrobiota bacterium]MCF7903638.1 dienelactone hydrolase family protein [Candidatus Neomarinimicrobiota bacterium]
MTHLKTYALGTALSMLVSVQSCSTVFPIVAPFKDLPPPTGSFSVGTRTTTWADSSRDETFTSQADHRRMVVQVWFPASETVSGDPSHYVDDPDLRMPALAKQLRLPVFPIKHFTQVLTNSYDEAIPDRSGATYPVIIFSHGLSGMRFQNTALMEELASHGYIVLAADHAYEANITIFPDGTTAIYAGGKRRSIIRGEATAHLDFSQLSIIVEDLKFIIDRVINDEPGELLEDLPINRDAIGVIGHSLGGAAVVNTAYEDERVDAVMVLDGWYMPVPDSVISSGVTQPYMHLGQKIWLDPRNYTRMDRMLGSSSGPQFKLLVSNTKHPDYTDMPLFSPFSRIIGYTATREPLALNQLIRISSLHFFNAYLKNKPVEPLIESVRGGRFNNSSIFIPNPSQE